MGVGLLQRWGICKVQIHIMELPERQLHPSNCLYFFVISANGQEWMLKSFQINDVHNIYSMPPSLKRGAWRAGNVSFRP